jgi:aspartyl-tRNA synthetase
MRYYTHSCGELRKRDIGKTVKLAGWVDSIRYHGKVVFINLRDRYGITQIVVRDEQHLNITKKIGHEWVITVNGKVLARPKGMENPNLSTGEIDVEAVQIEIISPSKVPPFVIVDDVKAKDELRLKYRYLDLRRPLMQKALMFKSQLCHEVRSYLHKQGFIDIETPILGRSTPEGARDFLVPSRLHPGKFYSLVQSPQIYKQLLMIAGFEKYYQIAKCLRDEDQRKDRQIEHTQIDIEVSFVDEEEIFGLIEGLMKHIFKKLLNIELNPPFDRLTYKDAIRKYGTDKPDVRYELFIEDVTRIAKKSSFQIFEKSEKVWCIVVDKLLTRKEIDGLTTIARGYGVGLSWLKYADNTFSGPLVKFFTQDSLKDLIGKRQVCTLLFTAGEERALFALGGIRNELIANHVPPKKEYKFVWITDFPIFERDKNTGEIVPNHHIFVMPKDLTQLEGNPELIIGKLYDLVLNGVELGSGSIRVHTRELQERLMKIIGIDGERREQNFGCLLSALEYGAPPHGGIALGLDRIAMSMLNTNSIQNVIAFPKTLTGLGLLEGIPSEVEKEQLDEVHLKIKQDES